MANTKMDYLKGEFVLAPFKGFFGGGFERLCKVWDSNLGTLQKDIQTTGKMWRCGSKGIISTTDGHKLQLQLNNPLHTLVRFGIRLTEVAQSGSVDKPVSYEMVIDSTPPFECLQWAKEFIANSTKSVNQADAVAK
jgi:hypothetical protein